MRDFEITCRDLLLKHCDPGEDSVGTGITVTHSGATLLGMSVEMTATVTAINGRLVKFAVSARDGVEAISPGEHSRDRRGRKTAGPRGGPGRQAQGSMKNITACRTPTWRP